MKDDGFFELVTKYLSNEASALEIERLNSCLEQKKYAALFHAIKTQWEQAGNTEKEPAPDLERGLMLFASKLRAHDPSFRWEKVAVRRHVFGYRPLFLRIAAACALLLVLATGTYILLSVLSRRSASIAWNEKKTAMGEKTMVTLLDGTRITLNADSKLKYPIHLGKGLREVYLEGEAYFEVAPDPRNPFVVHTGNISTTDLGTKFDISAFPDDPTVVVALEEGKVGVSTAGAGVTHGDIVLSPLQELIYDKEQHTSEVIPCDLLKAVGWKDNLLIFDNEPLSKILIPLERYFGVRFEVANASIADRLVKANFKNESLWTVTEVLKKATGLTTKTIQENNEIKKIVFYEK